MMQKLKPRTVGLKPSKIGHVDRVIAARINRFCFTVFQILLNQIAATASKLSIDNILLKILNVFDHSFWSSSE